jgi:hypothetical protein
MPNRFPTCLLMAIVIFSGSLAFGANYHLQLLTDELHIPVDADVVPGFEDKIFVSQLGGTAGDGNDGDDITKSEGRIVVYDRATGSVDYSNPLLTINDTSLTEPFGVPEIGLFSTAFHPDFQTNGKFYVNVAVNHSGQAPTVDTRSSPFKTVVREYTVDVNSAGLPITGSRTIFELDQPAPNHNGSWLGFNPVESAEGQNYLYVTQGDGGDQHDPANYGQDKGTWFGSVMRVDVDSDDFPEDVDRNYAIPPDNPFVGEAGVAEELWAYGLRNPWRASFDDNGDFWVSDVGQGWYEEINFRTAANAGGENYGWRLYEGDQQTPTGNVGGPPPAGPPNGDDPFVLPIYEYLHSNRPGDQAEYKGNSVTGGLVYRGPAEELEGRYFFADNVSGHIWSFDPADPYGTRQVMDDLLGDPGIFATSFSEDEQGNLLIVDGVGRLFQIVPFGRSDLDRDGDLDAGDWMILASNNLTSLVGLTAAEAQTLGDLDYDGDNDFDDFRLFQTDFDAAHGAGSFDLLQQVPEPTSVCLLLMAAFAAALVRRRCAEYTGVRGTGA